MYFQSLLIMMRKASSLTQCVRLYSYSCTSLIAGNLGGTCETCRQNFYLNNLRGMYFWTFFLLCLPRILMPSFWRKIACYALRKNFMSIRMSVKLGLSDTCICCCWQQYTRKVVRDTSCDWFPAIVVYLTCFSFCNSSSLLRLPCRMSDSEVSFEWASRDGWTWITERRPCGGLYRKRI